jgi:hypothetical protein
MKKMLATDRDFEAVERVMLGDISLAHPKCTGAEVGAHHPPRRPAEREGVRMSGNEKLAASPYHFLGRQIPRQVVSEEMNEFA